MDATLVTGWEALCQLLSPAFTRPTFGMFLHIATGRVLCRSRPTVTNLVCTIGTTLLGHAAKHWTAYERFFYQTLVKAWYLRYGVNATAAQPKGTDWAATKDHPSYLDMLATPRKALWTHRINIKSLLRGTVRELWKTLQFTLCAAA